MRVSEIEQEQLANYLRLTFESLCEAEKALLDTLFVVARAFIRSYTGLDDDGVDQHEDMVIAVFILVQDMYDNRVLYVERSNLNKTVEMILNMHSVNLL
jgi:hypothetical protein